MLCMLLLFTHLLLCGKCVSPDQASTATMFLEVTFNYYDKYLTTTALKYPYVYYGTQLLGVTSDLI